MKSEIVGGLTQELISRLNAKIKEYDALEKKEHEKGNIRMAMMFTNQKIGLLEAVGIALELSRLEVVNG